MNAFSSLSSFMNEFPFAIPIGLACVTVAGFLAFGWLITRGRTYSLRERGYHRTIVVGMPPAPPSPEVRQASAAVAMLTMVTSRSAKSAEELAFYRDAARSLLNMPVESFREPPTSSAPPPPPRPAQ